MEIGINLNGQKRKDLAMAVGELLKTEPVYQKAPSYAYEIGEVTMNRDNSLIFSAKTNPETIHLLLDGLQGKGFTVGELPDKLVIQMPLDGFDGVAMDNLQKLVAAKAELIKKALGVEELPIEQADEAICFSWFAFDTASEDVMAYSQFIAALCDMAKKQKRVLATEKSVENEKYAFRCFLLRLGFIGDEYANTRKVLLRNLTGNGSFKSEKTESVLGSRPSSGLHNSLDNSLPDSHSTAFEQSAEAVGKHVLRGLLQCLETILTES